MHLNVALVCAALLALEGAETLEAALLRGAELYYEGRYSEALPYLQHAATSSETSVTAEALRFKAFCLFLLQLYPEAKATWLQVLAVVPDVRLDPNRDSPELVAFFSQVELPPPRPMVISAPPPIGNSAPPPVGNSAPPPQDPMSSPVPASNTTLHPSPSRGRGCGTLLCLLPLGVGQFANERTAKGAVFASLELASLLGHVGVYWYRVGYYRDTGRVRGSDATLEAQLVAQRALLIAFAATALAGVGDAFLFP